MKDLNLLKRYIKYQETGYSFKLNYALSNRPYLHRAYVVTVCNQNFTAVYLKAANAHNWGRNNILKWFLFRQMWNLKKSFRYFNLLLFEKNIGQKLHCVQLRSEETK